MRRAGIIQSSYIPWRGYFDFIDDVDVFIFLDDVQYTHRTWRNRNRIKTQHGLSWLTVPVLHDRSTLIQDAEIDYSQRWVDKHIGALKQAYGKAPHFHGLADEFFGLLAARHRTISELNIAAALWIMGVLQIRTRVFRSGEFRTTGSREEKLIELLRHVDATVYLSGPSAADYLQPRRFEECRIGLEYKVYDYPAYPQLHGTFAGEVTVLDLLFNCGPDARSFLKARRPNQVVVAGAG